METMTVAEMETAEAGYAAIEQRATENGDAKSAGDAREMRVALKIRRENMEAGETPLSEYMTAFGVTLFMRDGSEKYVEVLAESATDAAIEVSHPYGVRVQMTWVEVIAAPEVETVRA